MPKIALITGVTGQDGSYLAEFLLEKGYGTPRKLLDVSRLRDLGWSARTNLRDGIRLACEASPMRGAATARTA